MNSRALTIAAVAALGVALLASGSAAASTGAVSASLSSHVWGTAEEVPGSAALNQGGDAGISVSCGAAGDCSAGGFYQDSSAHIQAFVASQINGTWRTAIEAPGTAALNQGGDAAVNSVSCASAGNCAAAGSYSNRGQAFVASEVNGTWHAAIEVPGTAALNQGGDAAVNSVSCAMAGNCAAVGYYTPSSRQVQAFVVNERPSH
jgi:hypothetical protein